MPFELHCFSRKRGEEREEESGRKMEENDALLYSLSLHPSRPSSLSISFFFLSISLL
jgi:hypothetical protein